MFINWIGKRFCEVILCLIGTGISLLISCWVGQDCGQPSYKDVILTFLFIYLVLLGWNFISPPGSSR